MAVELLASIYFAITSTHKNTPNDAVLIAVCVFVNDVVELMLISGAISANYCLTLSYVIAMAVCISLSIGLVILYELILWEVLFVYIIKLCKLALAFALSQLIKQRSHNHFDDC